jgi:hypothetical protein
LIFVVDKGISLTGKSAAEAFLSPGPTRASPAAPAADAFKKFLLLFDACLPMKKSPF